MDAPPIRIGLKAYQQVHPIATQREVWLAAEEAGFDHIWPYDHLVALGDPALPVYDGWTILAAIASVTTRIRIGLNVSGNLYRHPAITAKLATTVDHLSDGRLEMGIGAVRDGDEFQMFGMPFPPVGERIAMLDEACTVIRGLWTQPRFSHDGRYYRLTEAIAEPKPVQRPHPRIWIGGSGRTKTLAVVARHADVWHSNARTIEDTIDLSRVLDERCAEIGRDPGSLRRSVGIRMTEGKPPLEQARDAIDAGFSELLVNFGNTRADPLGDLDVAARLLPDLRDLAAR